MSTVADSTSGADADAFGAPPAGGRPARSRSRRRRARPWWIRAHRWTSLLVGLFLLAEASTGAVLLYEHDINRWAHPHRYQATAAQAPRSAAQSLALVRRVRPELNATQVRTVNGVHQVSDGSAEATWRDETAFVDPGRGEIVAVGRDRSWLLALMINVHDCALGCSGYPAYVGWTTAHVPGFGAEVTVADLALGATGVLLVVLVAGGLVIWWPPRRRFASGFRVRRGRRGYARNLDLHRVVGIASLPLLFVWGFTAASFVFEWPEKVHAAVTPGRYTPPTPDPVAGAGRVLTFAHAQNAVAALHPDGEILGFTAHEIATNGGYWTFRVRDGFDPYRYSYFPGNVQVVVDSHGGAVVDDSNTAGPLPERAWNNDLYRGLHYGSLVPGRWRLLWLAFGLTPLLLAFTGTAMWLTKRRSARARRDAAAGREG